MRRWKVHVPVPVMRAMVWTAEKSLLTLPITSAQLAMITRDNITSLDVIQKVFGFKPISLSQRIDGIVH